MAFKDSIFRKMMTPEQIQYGDRMEAELTRLFSLSDVELGEEILRLARATREKFPEHTKRAMPHGDTYTTALFWDIAPELAKRLGAPGVDETIRPDVSSKSDAELRIWVGSCVNNTGWSPALGTSDRYMDASLCPWEMLTHTPVNGNPLAMAIDRLAPVTTVELNDSLAASMREVSGFVGFEEPLLMWRPSWRDDAPSANPLADMLPLPQGV